MANGFKPALVFLSLATLLASTACINAQAEPDYRGRISKQGARVARPTSDDQPIYNLNALEPARAPIKVNVQDDTFVLGANTLTGAASSESWNPWAGLSVPKAKRPELAAHAQRTEATAAAEDYDAIEKAYEEAVPRPLPPAMPASASPGAVGANSFALAASNAAAAQSYYLRQRAQSANRGGNSMVGGCPPRNRGNNAGISAGTRPSAVATPGSATAAVPGVAAAGIAPPGVGIARVAVPTAPVLSVRR